MYWVFFVFFCVKNIHLLLKLKRTHVRKSKINVSRRYPNFSNEKCITLKECYKKCNECYCKYTNKSNIYILDCLKNIKYSVEILPKKNTLLVGFTVTMLEKQHAHSSQDFEILFVKIFTPNLLRLFLRK